MYHKKTTNKAFGVDVYLCLGIVLLFGSLPFGSLLFASSPSADYPVEAGDVIEISIGGMIQVHNRAVVQPDGTVTFPQVGTISVTGLSASEIRTTIQAALLGKTIRHRSPEGRLIPITIEADDVAASVVEYRPVYVMGDVSKPGQYAFHPNITVRQAVAVAGGYDLLQIGEKPSLLRRDLQGEFDAGMVQFASLTLREARVKAELADLQSIDETLPRDVQVPAATLAALVHAEYELFKTHRDEYKTEKGFFERSVKRMDEIIVSLNDQLKQEGDTATADARELEDLLRLQKSGHAANPRVSESRHAASNAAARRQQLKVQLDQARQQREDFQKQLARLESQRKISLLDDLKDCAVKEIELRFKLNGLRDKLSLVSRTRAQEGRGTFQSLKIVVVRKGQKSRQRLLVDEDFELQPGDVVEIAIAADYVDREIAVK